MTLEQINFAKGLVVDQHFTGPTYIEDRDAKIASLNHWNFDRKYALIQDPCHGTVWLACVVGSTIFIEHPFK